MAHVDPALAARLFRTSGGERWGLPLHAFVEALERSAHKCPQNMDLPRFLDSLHLGDLALAAACEHGLDAAWEHFIREFRPTLYRAAQAIARSGDPRELADSLYAELYGVRDKGGARPSLFRYFHGRSTLATWLRSVLAQRHIDQVRAGRRFQPLPEEDEPGVLRSAAVPAHPRARPCADLVNSALAAAVGLLPARDRLRLRCYYAQQMTLAETGRLLKEHEATVSRNLARTRSAVRVAIEEALRASGLGPEATDECLALTMADPGMMDANELLPAGPERKMPPANRSKLEDPS
jgi:RNA polymerase sigma-70 factor, ECF subfamily